MAGHTRAVLSGSAEEAIEFEFDHAVKCVVVEVTPHGQSPQNPGFLCVCQAAISVPVVAALSRCSSAIMRRQRWLASRRFRHRIASLRVLPSAILVSK